MACAQKMRDTLSAFSIEREMKGIDDKVTSPEMQLRKRVYNAADTPLTMQMTDLFSDISASYHRWYHT